MRSTMDFDIDKLDALEQSDGSYVDRDGCITWYNELGQLHREEGPALILPDGKKWWYLNETLYSFDNWCIELNKSDEARMMLRLSYA
jgi:hypothetical protein